PVASRLTRTGATSRARLLVMAGSGAGGAAVGRGAAAGGRGGGEEGAGGAGAGRGGAGGEGQGAWRADLARGVPGDLQRQQEMGVDGAAGRVETGPSRRRGGGGGGQAGGDWRGAGGAGPG